MGVAAQKVNQNLPNLGLGVKNVLVLEKMPVIGGNTLRCASAFNAADPDRQKALPMTETLKEAVVNPSLADSGKQKALNSLTISEFRAFLNYCLVYMLEHVFNQFRNCLLCCKSYS